MANKFRPGIPDGFSLDVEPVRDLGDYLDEPRPAPVPQRRAREAPPVPEMPLAAAEVASPPVTARPAPPAAEAPVPPAAASVGPATTPPPVAPANAADTAAAPAPEHDGREGRGLRPKAPRREISMTPETLRMSDELLEVVRRGSGQRDTKANELFHALVLLVYEVIDEIDPHAIPKRGRWGTPTARAYPLELKNAFLKAVLEKHAAANDAIRLQYPANDAA